MITRMNKTRETRRELDVAGRRVCLWFRWSESRAQWEMAAAPPRTLRRKLRWRRMQAVLWEAFAMDVGHAEQMKFESDKEAVA